MKKEFLALAAVAALVTAAHAQQNTALSQLIDPSDINVSVPAASLPARGGVVTAVANPWDPAAPFSYNQLPAQLFRAGGATGVRNVRSGPAPADHKSYKWETVTVNAARIEKVLYGYRLYGTGHSFLVFIFNDGGAVDARGQNVRALTFGAEAWSREPYGFTLSHALLGRYPLIWVATTFESYTDYIAVVKKKDTFFKVLALGPEQNIRLFRLLLARVDETNRNRETYNLFNNSCTNNPVDLINQVIPAAARISLDVAGLMNPYASIPKFAVQRYTANGVLTGEAFRLGADNAGAFDVNKI